MLNRIFRLKIWFNWFYFYWLIDWLINLICKASISCNEKHKDETHKWTYGSGINGKTWRWTLKWTKRKNAVCSWSLTTQWIDSDLFNIMNYSNIQSVRYLGRFQLASNVNVYYKWSLQFSKHCTFVFMWKYSKSSSAPNLNHFLKFIMQNAFTYTLRHFTLYSVKIVFYFRSMHQMPI